MSRDFDVIVVGAGVVGAATAASLAVAGLCAPGRVALLTDAPPPAAADDWDLRVYALSRASERLLRFARAWDALPPQRKEPYERMCVWDASGTAGGRGSLTFDCADIGEANLGVIVDGRALQIACLAAARDAGVLVMEATLTGVESGAGEIRVRLGQGRELGAGLLVGAAGTDSTVRALLGIGTAGHAYLQDAVVAHVTTSRPHENTAWQRFLPGGPLAFLPLPDGRSSIVWSVARTEAARLRALDHQGFADELTAASGEALGRCVPTTPLASFPLKLQYALDYARPRAVLVGDAAHVVHPLAGQGLNLGLMDCAALIETLRDAPGPGAFGDRRVLRRYERWRRSENLFAAAALDGFERLFSSTSFALSRLRTGGLEAVGRLPALKRAIAMRALGLEGDVPAFLTGGLPSPRR
jgi:ubiquinone biosynthesis UbiH/UbiF/VisC/COQ6 family hydroxylase